MHLRSSTFHAVGNATWYQNLDGPRGKKILDWRPRMGKRRPRQVCGESLDAGGIGPVTPEINWGGLCSAVDSNGLIWWSEFIPPRKLLTLFYIFSRSCLRYVVFRVPSRCFPSPGNFLTKKKPNNISPDPGVAPGKQSVMLFSQVQTEWSNYQLICICLKQFSLEIELIMV